MTKQLLYIVPISLIGLLAALAPADAAIRSDGADRDTVIAPAKSTEAPMILAQRGGRGGGGMRGGGGGMRGGGGGMRGGGGYAGARGGAGGFIRSPAAGSRNWSGVSASNRSF